jgi:RNA polymerase sigma-70 factor (ECF subfamily)
MEPVASQGVIDAAEASVDPLLDFDTVVRDWWPRVFRFALASLRDRDAAETVAQDCFFKAYQARHRFRGDASLKTWLMQIAVNLVRDRIRNRRLQFWKRFDAQVDPGVPDRHGSPEAEASARQQVAAVWDAAGLLPEKQRTVFLLRFVEELDLLEIAAATGMKEGTVKAHLFRALKTIRERLVK